MLNHLDHSHAITMEPDGSLNKLPVSGSLLHPNDPLFQRSSLTGFDLVSSSAFKKLLAQLNHRYQDNLRGFLSYFSNETTADRHVLTLFAHRFTAILTTAKRPTTWGNDTLFLRDLGQFWQQTNTVVISGGLSSNDFGIQLAELCEELSGNLAVICSPWSGSTALYGMAQTVSQVDSLLVLDFGATGIKRGLAEKYGNRITFLPELLTSDYKVDGRIEGSSVRHVLKQTQQLVNTHIPVAMSIACYLDHGHPFQYSSGIYYNVGNGETNLQETLKNSWLPDSGLGDLKLLVHDSTAAALAFRFKDPAMMVTMGTGLGSAPCPLDK